MVGNKMTPQEKLEEEIEILEKAKVLINDKTYSLITPHIDSKKLQLEALKKPKFRDGTLGKCNAFNNIVVYRDVLGAEMGDFYPLPIETILRHLAPEGAVRWAYNSANSCWFIDKNGSRMENERGYNVSIPAPYREDWEGIGGAL